MNSRKRIELALPSYPKNDVESPFLDEELFTGESEADSGSHLSALEAESPFLHAFEENFSHAVEPALYAEAFGEDEETEADTLFAEEDLEAKWDSGPQEYYEEQFETEIFGTNDMDSVANTLAVPHRWICRLDIEYEITPWNSTRKLTGRGRETGTLISPCHILTAAHNLSSYDPVGRNFLRATRIRATPAHDGSGTPPVASVDADMSNSHIHPRWVVSRRVIASGASNAAGEVATNRYDYALLTLTRSIGQSSVRALGAPLGYWARQGSGGAALFERLDPNLISSNPVSVSGYGFDTCVIDVRRARSKPAIPLGSSLTASGNITLMWEGARPRYIGRSMAHNADTCGGQSGAPVWLLHDGKYYLVGIHTGGVGLTNGGRTNHAVRVTGELIRQVNDWMTRSPCHVTPSARELEESFEGEALYLDEELEDYEEVENNELEDDQLEEEDFDEKESYDDEYEDEEEYDALEETGESLFELYDKEESPYAQIESRSEGQTVWGEDLLNAEERWLELEGGGSAEPFGEGAYREEEFLVQGFSTEAGEDDGDLELFEMEQSPAVPANVAEFAVTLGRKWAKRRNGSPSAEKITGWLLMDYQDTLTGARRRFEKYPGDPAIGRAWMVSRQEQMKFKTSFSSAVKALGNFQPPTQSVALVTNQSLVRDSHKAPVAPIVLRFVQALRQQYPAYLDVFTYRNHGGGKFKNRGFSVDLRLKGSDERGFYPPEEAKNFLRALHRTASATGVEWRVIYNDFSVADSINRETGKTHVIFVGTVRRQNKKVTGLNWHGPDPLILHLHLDLAPGSGAPAPSSSAGTVNVLPTWLSEIVKGGLLTLQAAWAMLSGQRDVDSLTNMIFYARHPDLPVGYKIKPHEKQLAESWVRIRDDVVKPILRRLAAGAASGGSAGSGLSPSPTSTSTSVKPSPSVIADVEKYRSLVEAAAAQYGVDSALIRGVIAAESGGDKDLVAKSGFTGLMQSKKDESHKQAAISIDDGTKKLRDFRNVMEGILKERGRRYDQLPQAEQLRLLVLSYNAGFVTVAKALQYAAEAGNPERWLDAEHYKRALFFTGAYSLSQAAPSCLKGVSPTERASLMREANRVWRRTRLKARLVEKKTRIWRKLEDPQPWSSVMATLPPFLVCAIDFKHRNAPKYADRILAYRNSFLQR